MTDQQRLDGGRNALVGFLYQIIGALGMRASAAGRWKADEATGLDALVKFASSGQVLGERYGQDVVLKHFNGLADGVVLVQFKYSSSVRPRPISPSELTEIVRGLAHSRRYAEEEGAQVTGYFLITNRATPKPQSTARGKPRSAAARIDREIRDKLVPIQDVPLSYWHGVLKEFASQFGCFDYEVEDGVRWLIGDLVQRMSAGVDVPIEERDLIRAFTQTPSAEPLVGEKLTTKCLNLAYAFGRGMSHPGPIVLRKLPFDRLSEQVLERAIIVLEGAGGCGKSTALYDWVRTLLEQPQPRHGTVSAIWRAGNFDATGLVSMLCRFAGVSQPPHVRWSEPNETALQRLIIANPEARRPIFILGMDGLDEGADLARRRSALGEVLSWFWNEDEIAQRDGRPPLATLIVTCRRANDIDPWLTLNPSGFRAARTPIAVSVNIFSPEELLTAAELTLPSHHAVFVRSVGRIKASQHDRASETPALDQPCSEADSGWLIDADVLESLRHPVLWRSLLELNCDESQSRVLKGDKEALQRLAFVFTNWFCEKARQRRFDTMQTGTILQVLGSIARSCCEKNGTFTYADDWLPGGKSAQTMSDPEIRAIYCEALSAGYIEESEQSRWRWRHNLCVDYLASVGGRDHVAPQ